MVVDWQVEGDVMANLGTLDQMAGSVANNYINRGSDIDKLLATLGAYWGTREANGRINADNKKYDEIINMARTNPGITSGMTEAEAQAGVPVHNPDYTLDNIEAQARKAGIAQSVIDSRRDATRQGIAQSADSIYLPMIQRGLYGYTDANGNYIAPTVDSRLQAMEQIREYSKYNPEAAKGYSALANAGMQGDVNFLRQKELKQMEGNNALARTIANKVTGKTSRDNPLKISDQIALGKRVSELEATLKERYPDGRMDPNDTDVQQWKAGRLALGLDEQTQNRDGNTAQTPSTTNREPIDDKEKTAPKKGIKERFKERVEAIDVDNWDSINKGGLELVKMLQDNGMNYKDAMRNVLEILKPRISAEEYATFKGDFRTPEEEVDYVLNWGGKGANNTVRNPYEDILKYHENKMRNR